MKPRPPLPSENATKTACGLQRGWSGFHPGAWAPQPGWSGFHGDACMKPRPPLSSENAPKTAYGLQRGWSGFHVGVGTPQQGRSRFHQPLRHRRHGRSGFHHPLHHHKHGRSGLLHPLPRRRHGRPRFHHPPPSPQVRAAPLSPARSSPRGSARPAFQCDQRHRQQLTGYTMVLPLKGASLPLRRTPASTRP